MIFYVVKKIKRANAMQAYGQFWEGLRLLPYEDLFKASSLAPGVYIFADIDRLSSAERHVAAVVWRQLARYPERVRLLNDPSKVLCRYELMLALANSGVNHYCARYPAEGLKGLHYPVFIRKERGHKGAMTPLLHSAREVRQALVRMYVLGYRKSELLIIEFCDTSDVSGLFRKYSAFMVGDEILPRHLLISRNWHLKTPDITDADAMSEVEAYLEGNPHEEAIRHIFRQAKIDYGRIDYSMLDDQLQVWEINTNPSVRKLAERLTAAFVRLNEIVSPHSQPILIQINADLLLAVERDVRAERRIIEKRRRRRETLGKFGFGSLVHG